MEKKVNIIDSIDLNNPIFVCPHSPQAEWKGALIAYMGRHFNLLTLVETGTCYGDTIGRVMHVFKDVWSIELCTEYFEASKARFASNPNIHLIFGSSGDMLPSVINQTAGPLLFWLDAHATGGISAGNGDQITTELEAIKNLRPDSLVLIDDVAPGENGTYHGPDTTIVVPEGWQFKFLSGIYVTHAGGYTIPDKF